MELNTIKNNSRWEGVAGDLNNNFQKVGIELEKQKHFSNRFKGLFSDVNKLNAAVPNPQAGDWAIIGKTIPGPVWTYANDSWSATGDIGGAPRVTIPEISGQYGDDPDKGVSQQFFTQEVRGRFVFVAMDLEMEADFNNAITPGYYAYARQDSTGEIKGMLVVSDNGDILQVRYEFSTIFTRMRSDEGWTDWDVVDLSKDKHILLTEAAYEALVAAGMVNPDTIYMTYEEE